MCRNELKSTDLQLEIILVQVSVWTGFQVAAKIEFCSRCFDDVLKPAAFNTSTNKEKQSQASQTALCFCRGPFFILTSRKVIE